MIFVHHHNHQFHTVCHWTCSWWCLVGHKVHEGDSWQWVVQSTTLNTRLVSVKVQGVVNIKCRFKYMLCQVVAPLHPSQCWPCFHRLIGSCHVSQVSSLEKISVCIAATTSLTQQHQTTQTQLSPAYTSLSTWTNIQWLLQRESYKQNELQYLQPTASKQLTINNIRISIAATFRS